MLQATGVVVFACVVVLSSCSLVSHSVACLHIQLHVFHIQLHVGLLSDRRSARGPPVAMTPAGHQGPPPLLPPYRPVLRGRTAARCQPGGNKGNLLYFGWQSGLPDQPPPPEPLMRPG
jgi:hypothetical protein